MINVTDVVKSKTKSVVGDLLASGKKCKYYQDLKKVADEGKNIYYQKISIYLTIYITKVQYLIQMLMVDVL